eukprot:3232814-Prymnesium_polylepis.1
MRASSRKPIAWSAASSAEDLTAVTVAATAVQRRADEALFAARQAQREADRLRREADAMQQAAELQVEAAVPVFLRVRAHPQAPIDQIHQLTDAQGTVQVQVGERMFCFDRGGGEETSQDQVFRAVGQPLCDACLAGFNGTVFVYGQTGSGKTHTMHGPPYAQEVRGSSSDKGLAPRAIEYVFASMAREQAAAGGAYFRCSASFVQIYNDSLSDLLAPRARGVASPRVDSSGDGHRVGVWTLVGTPDELYAICSPPLLAGAGGSVHSALRIRESIERGVFVEGLREVRLQSAEEAREVLARGLANRRVGLTRMNETSSRSHSLFFLTLHRVIPTVPAAEPQHAGTPCRGSSTSVFERVRTSQLCLVDLAGSERQQTGANPIDYAAREHAAASRLLAKRATSELWMAGDGEIGAGGEGMSASSATSEGASPLWLRGGPG